MPWWTACKFYLKATGADPAGLPRRVIYFIHRNKGVTMAESLEDYMLRIDRWLSKAGFDSGEINDYIVEHEEQIKAGFEAGTDVEELIHSI